MAERFRSGDALFASALDMTVVLWNAEAERLTKISAREALGRPCWDVLRGVGEDGSLICHPGCSAARLAREGWPVPCRRFLIKTDEGRKLISSRTIAVELDEADAVVLHVLHNGEVQAENGDPAEVSLTPRQREVLELVAEGLPAKVIASRLRIAQVTVRNHIQAILSELRCHSQLEAVAKARRRGIL